MTTYKANVQKWVNFKNHFLRSALVVSFALTPHLVPQFAQAQLQRPKAPTQPVRANRSQPAPQPAPYSAPAAQAPYVAPQGNPQPTYQTAPRASLAPTRTIAPKARPQHIVQPNSSTVAQPTAAYSSVATSPNSSTMPSPITVTPLSQVGSTTGSTAAPTYAPVVASGGSSPQLTHDVNQMLGGGDRIQVGGVQVDAHGLRQLYAQRGNRPAFVSDGGPTRDAQALRTLIDQNADTRGLETSYYWTPRMDQLWNASTRDPRARAELEVLLSNAYVRFARDVSVGRTNPADIDPEIKFRPRPFDNYAALNSALGTDADKMAQTIDSLEPQHPQYKKLRVMMELLDEAEEQGGWTPLQGTQTLRPGETSSDVPGIRQRMIDLRLLPATERGNMSQTYDPALVGAVKLFQENFKLENDGVIGAKTFEEMKVPLKNRTDQVRANLERWRWLPNPLPSRHILVDLGQQELEVRENGNRLFQMPVVVGREARSTPSFQDKITDVVLNPTWTAPRTVIGEDFLPLLVTNPLAMKEKGITLYKYVTGAKGERSEVAMTDAELRGVDWQHWLNEYNRTKDSGNPKMPPYKFVQAAGAENSLGRLKFNLTNGDAIYLHDTPNRELFEKSKRMFSSGCIRVQDPSLLAAYILQGLEGLDSKEEIDSYTTPPAGWAEIPPNWVNYRATPTAQVPVYIMDLSVAVSDSGLIRFGDDAYGRDARINAALDNPGFPSSHGSVTPSPNPQVSGAPSSTIRPRPRPRQ